MNEKSNIVKRLKRCIAFRTSHCVSAGKSWLEMEPDVPGAPVLLIRLLCKRFSSAKQAVEGHPTSTRSAKGHTVGVKHNSTWVQADNSDVKGRKRVPSQPQTR